MFEEGDYYAQSDLNAFFTQYSPNVPNGTHPILDSVDGGEAPVPASSPYNTGESDIDLDMMYSLIYPQEVVLYQVGCPAKGPAGEPGQLTRSQRSTTSPMPRAPSPTRPSTAS